MCPNCQDVILFKSFAGRSGKSPRRSLAQRPYKWSRSLPVHRSRPSCQKHLTPDILHLTSPTSHLDPCTFDLLAPNSTAKQFRLLVSLGNCSCPSTTPCHVHHASPPLLDEPGKRYGPRPPLALNLQSMRSSHHHLTGFPA